jgi:hypothetical protein
MYKVYAIHLGDYILLRNVIHFIITPWHDSPPTFFEQALFFSLATAEKMHVALLG